MSPTAAASFAEGAQPSMPSILIAFSGPMSRAKCTDEQPSGGTPNRAKGVENEAPLAATTQSASVAVVTEAPMAGPFTATHKGFGNSRNVSNTRLLKV
jgi:hypothetical protein